MEDKFDQRGHIIHFKNIPALRFVYLQLERFEGDEMIRKREKAHHVGRLKDKRATAMSMTFAESIPKVMMEVCKQSGVWLV